MSTALPTAALPPHRPSGLTSARAPSRTPRHNPNRSGRRATARLKRWAAVHLPDGPRALTDARAYRYGPSPVHPSRECILAGPHCPRRVLAALAAADRSVVPVVGDIPPDPLAAVLDPSATTDDESNEPAPAGALLSGGSPPTPTSGAPPGHAREAHPRPHRVSTLGRTSSRREAGHHAGPASLPVGPAGPGAPSV